MAPVPRYADAVDGEVSCDHETSTRGEQLTDVHKYLKQHNVLCHDRWHWDELDKAPEVNILGDDNLAVMFHPNWSNGTAGIRASRPLCGDINYWEIHVGDRLFGTSLMFGVTTKSARLHTHEFKHLLGEGGHGWALSHKGKIHHNGESDYFCATFTEHTPTVIGVLVDKKKGDMTFFKDGTSLGVAFRNITKVTENLYPTISSTAAKSSMRLGRRWRSYVGLQDRCRHVIIATMTTGSDCTTSINKMVDQLPLPTKIKNFIRNGL